MHAHTDRTSMRMRAMRRRPAGTGALHGQRCLWPATRDAHLLLQLARMPAVAFRPVPHAGHGCTVGAVPAAGRPWVLYLPRPPKFNQIYDSEYFLNAFSNLPKIIRIGLAAAPVGAVPVVGRPWVLHPPRPSNFNQIYDMEFF